MTNKYWVRPIDVRFDLKAALDALDQVSAVYPFSATRTQISLTHRSESGSVEDGVGTLYDFKKSTWAARERDFRYFNLAFRQSYFYELYRTMQEYTENRIGRVRLMCLAPKACYSMHRDPTVRYHFVLKTNSDAFLIFGDGQIFCLPADGRVFYADTRALHTAMNGGREPRVHLVMTEVESDHHSKIGGGR